MKKIDRVYKYGSVLIFPMTYLSTMNKTVSKLNKMPKKCFSKKFEISAGSIKKNKRIVAVNISYFVDFEDASAYTIESSAAHIECALLGEFVDGTFEIYNVCSLENSRGSSCVKEMIDALKKHYNKMWLFVSLKPAVNDRPSQERLVQLYSEIGFKNPYITNQNSNRSEFVSETKNIALTYDAKNSIPEVKKVNKEIAKIRTLPYFEIISADFQKFPNVKCKELYEFTNAVCNPKTGGFINLDPKNDLTDEELNHILPNKTVIDDVRRVLKEEKVKNIYDISARKSIETSRFPNKVVLMAYLGLIEGPEQFISLVKLGQEGGLDFKTSCRSESCVVFNMPTFENPHKDTAATRLQDFQNYTSTQGDAAVKRLDKLFGGTRDKGIEFSADVYANGDVEIKNKKVPLSYFNKKTGNQFNQLRVDFEGGGGHAIALLVDHDTQTIYIYDGDSYGVTNHYSERLGEKIKKQFSGLSNYNVVTNTKSSCETYVKRLQRTGAFKGTRLYRTSSRGMCYLNAYAAIVMLICNPTYTLASIHDLMSYIGKTCPEKLVQLMLDLDSYLSFQKM